jgi:hypothetical protein
VFRSCDLLAYPLGFSLAHLAIFVLQWYRKWYRDPLTSSVQASIPLWLMNLKQKQIACRSQQWMKVSSQISALDLHRWAIDPSQNECTQIDTQAFLNNCKPSLSRSGSQLTHMHLRCRYLNCQAKVPSPHSSSIVDLIVCEFDPKNLPFVKM